MRQFILVCLVLLTIRPNTYSQLVPLFSNFRDNTPFTNPAIPIVHTIQEARMSSSQDYSLVVGLNTRLQWWSFGKERPKTQTFFVQSRIKSQSRIKLWVGAYAIGDQTGPGNFVGIYPTLNGRVPFKNRQFLHFGFSMGYHQFGYNDSKLDWKDTSDPLYGAAGQRHHRIDPGIGLFYTQRKFYLGISLPRFLNFEIGNSYSLNWQPHILAGGYIRPDNDQINFIEPSIWIRSFTNSPDIIDLNLKVQFADRMSAASRQESAFWTAIGGSLNQTLRGELGFSYKDLKPGNLMFRKYRFSFSYSHPISVESVGSLYELRAVFLR